DADNQRNHLGPARDSIRRTAGPIKYSQIEQHLPAHEHAGDDGGEGQKIADESPLEFDGKPDVAPGADEIKINPVENTPDEDRGQCQQEKMVRPLANRAI